MNGAGFHDAGFWFRFPAGGNGFTRIRTKRAFLILTHLVVSAGRAFLAVLVTSEAESLVQVFFFSIFRFSTMSLRLSKLETVRVVDLAPSFSACSS